MIPREAKIPMTTVMLVVHQFEMAANAKPRPIAMHTLYRNFAK